MASPKHLFEACKLAEEGRVEPADVDTITAWSLKQDQIPTLSQEQVVLFLMACCNDCEATKSTILAFYSIRKATPDFFNDRDVKRADLQKAMQTVQLCTSPERTANNSAILIMRLRDATYHRLDMGPVMKYGMMTLDSIVYDNPPDSFIAIMDMEGFGLMHLTRIVFRYLKPFFRYVQEALPVRLDEILVVNTVYFINKVMAIIKPFMDPKLMDKLHFQPSGKDTATFLEGFVAMKCVPEDYGGSAPKIEKLSELNIEKLERMSDYFRSEEMQRS